MPAEPSAGLNAARPPPTAATNWGQTMQQRTGTAADPRLASGADAAATAVQPGQRRVLARSAILTLGPIGTSPRTARVSAIAQLSQWGRRHLADDTAAIVAELVANAVAASVPSGTPVGLGMILTDSSVVVEVFDRAPGEPDRARRRPSLAAACTWWRPCRASGAGRCCAAPRWCGPRSRRERTEASEPGPPDHRGHGRPAQCHRVRRRHRYAAHDVREHRLAVLSLMTCAT